ncbi:hypothetical protein [Sinorhizobium medicae]|uniref:hypothetical protein n=1 Tax=Sinorhizobium medicae TaxID=110321 RepID=UPI0011B3F205|nr:hypothetical protein [Sinorhizobium medicae]
MSEVINGSAELVRLSVHSILPLFSLLVRAKEFFLRSEEFGDLPRNHDESAAVQLRAINT